MLDSLKSILFKNKTEVIPQTVTQGGCVDVSNVYPRASISNVLPGREINMTDDLYSASIDLVPKGQLKDGERLVIVTDETGNQRYYAVKK